MCQREAEFEVWQDGMMVAAVCGPEIQAKSEIWHYAAQYALDGEVEVRGYVRDEDGKRIEISP
jgi:hypothetical protein